jgi:hypothetical protein
MDAPEMNFKRNAARNTAAKADLTCYIVLQERENGCDAERKHIKPAPMKIGTSMNDTTCINASILLFSPKTSFAEPRQPITRRIIH